MFSLFGISESTIFPTDLFAGAECLCQDDRCSCAGSCACLKSSVNPVMIWSGATEGLNTRTNQYNVTSRKILR